MVAGCAAPETGAEPTVEIPLYPQTDVLAEVRSSENPSQDSVSITALSCLPSGASGAFAVEDPAAATTACERLAELGAGDFAATPPDVSCTAQHGGPWTAIISGRINGEQIDAVFDLTDGCEIARWGKFDFLLDPAKESYLAAFGVDGSAYSG